MPLASWVSTRPSGETLDLIRSRPITEAGTGWSNRETLPAPSSVITIPTGNEGAVPEMTCCDRSFHVPCGWTDSAAKAVPTKETPSPPIYEHSH